MKKLRFFGKLIYGCNAVVAFLLLISFILPYMPPKSFPTLAILSLGVSPLILINLLFVLYWALRRKKQFLLSAIVLFIAYLHFGSFFEISSEGNAEDHQHTVSIMSYNVRLFNAYEETGQKGTSEAISELLQNHNPDVVFIQEYYKNSQVRLDNYPYAYTHFKKTTSSSTGKTSSSILGHAIFSKYPIVNTGAFDFENTYNNTLYADLVKGEDTLRLYNLHLKSIGIEPTVSSLQEGDKTKLRARMALTFAAQEEQVIEILNHKGSSPYPVILAGDFNNTPFSYIYRKLKEGMKDAFVERGNGLGTTYSFDSYPMRIDYIFASESLEVLRFENTKKTFSDHYPITATLGW